MRFESPYFLFLLIPLVIFVIISLKRGRPSVIIPSIRPFRAETGRKSMPLKLFFPFVFEVSALVLMIFALARPQQGIEELKQRAEGIDIMLAIDISGSMQAIDVPAKYDTTEKLRLAMDRGLVKPRFEIAKDEIRKFIKRRPNDRMGLIAFAPQPYLASPPTLDHSWLLAQLGGLRPGVIGDGTGLAGPLASAVKRLKSMESKRKIIVLFTDGRNNIDSRITPLQASQLAGDNKIAIYTVGIGSDNAFIEVDDLFGKRWQRIMHEFDEAILGKIAENTGGKYFRAEDSEGLEKTMNEINKLEKTNFEQPKFMDYRELAFPIIKVSIILFLAAVLLLNTFLLTLP